MVKERTRFRARPLGRDVSLGVAAVWGVFCVVVATLLIANYVQIRVAAPLDDPSLLALKQELVKSPETTPELVRQIEALDLLARKAYLTSEGHIRVGAWLLLAGAAVFLISFRLSVWLNRRAPLPEGESRVETFWALRRSGRRAVWAAGAGLALVAVGAGLLTDLRIPKGAEPDGSGAAEEADVAPPSWSEVEANWPSFRGPGSYGVARYTTAPTEWDGASGKNIKWKVEVPLPGRNSPVVWGDRVYLSGGNETERSLFGFDAETGALLWQHKVELVAGAEPPKLSEDTGHAPSTMVAHGTRVFAIFPSGDVVCCDRDGKRLWLKSLGLPENHYGHSSSLLAWGDLLYVQYDQMKGGKLLALDVADGHEVWSAARQYISWSSPACVPTAQGQQLILNSEKNVDSYDPSSGKLLWQVKCLDGEVAPSPAYGGGRIFVANEYAMATALTLGGTAELPSASVAWEWDEALPDVSSPVGDGTYFYVATSMGYVVCLEGATGKTAWHHEYDEGFYSSPVVVGDRVYVSDRAGVTHVFRTGAEFVSLGDSALGEGIYATPAFMDGRIYLRGETRLWCVEGEK